MTNTRYPLAVALVAAAIGVTACSDAREGGGNAKLCADFKVKTAAPIGGPDGASSVDECVKRWAYSLAGSRDEAGAVADAAVTACGAQLSRWNQQIVGAPGADGEAMSLTTGQPTSPLAEHNAFTHGRALFYVVQARAGRCPAPPITNGAPEGTG